MPPDNMRDWIGRSQTVEDLIAPWPVRGLSATLDENDPEPKNGDPLPPLWHWIYFHDAAPESKLGPDGHAERGDFLPPIPLPRRMWAGSRFTFDGPPLRIGETASRKSEIKSVEPKSGSTGSMVFVTVRHTLSGARGAAFVEEQDIVYREAAKPPVALAIHVVTAPSASRRAPTVKAAPAKTGDMARNSKLAGTFVEFDRRASSICNVPSSGPWTISPG